jgi:hypothetical protein
MRLADEQPRPLNFMDLLSLRFTGKERRKTLTLTSGYAIASSHHVDPAARTR